MRKAALWSFLYLLTAVGATAAGCNEAVVPDGMGGDTPAPGTGGVGVTPNSATGGKDSGTTCCLPGAKCKANQPHCEIQCEGDKVACAAGELCEENARGKVVGCVDKCSAEATCGSACCAPGARCSDDGQCEAADLAITEVTLQDGAFTTVEVAEGACEIQDGVYDGAGRRTVIPFELTIENVGAVPFEVGEPWESPAFYLSACASEYLTTNFIQAEVLSADDEVVAVRHLPTSCIADEESGTYRCSSQGLAAADVSVQPQNGNSLDVTGLPAGEYKVRFRINADGRFAEADFTNNTAEATLVKPDCDASFCGSVCCPDGTPCVDGICMLPDLRANEDSVRRSMVIGKQVFGENSCEMAEACITGPGKRRLLKFEGRIENLGPGDLNPGPEEGNPLFEFSECHGHHHFLDFTDYRLLKPSGATETQGHKQSFCLINMDQVEDYTGPTPGVHPEPGEQGCSYLSAGWADIYGVGTPCQWVDITDVPPGDYVLQVAVNPIGKIPEAVVANNVVQVPVTIPPDAPCQEQEVCGDVVDQDCDGNSDAQDWDCRESAYCCGGTTDLCGLEDNWSCDCGGEPEWEHDDCAYGGSGGFGQGGQGGGGNGGPCCNEEDSCNWANDGICDCNGSFSWDDSDCDYGYGGYYPGTGGSFTGAGGSVAGICCEADDPCDWSGDGFCDCNGLAPWDTQDCSPGSGAFPGAGGTMGGPSPGGSGVGPIAGSGGAH